MKPILTPNQEHPDQLLPWLVNETLSGDERKKVEDHIKTCDRCQKEVTILQRIKTHIKETPIQSPGDFGLHRLLKEVRKEKDLKFLQNRSPSGWRRRSLAIAASFIILIQAGIIIDALFLSKPVVLLSGPQEQGIVLQVTFMPEATESEIRKSLSEVNGAFIGGPGELGVYRIRLDASIKNDKKVKQAIEHLRQKKSVISFVSRE